MPKNSKQTTRALAEPPSVSCGPFEPVNGDYAVKDTDTPDKVCSMVQLALDDHTGVFLFRHKNRMYLRYIEIG